ncbi:hypothetical protein [Streptomyces sp. P5_D11]
MPTGTTPPGPHSPEPSAWLAHLAAPLGVALAAFVALVAFLKL